VGIESGVASRTELVFTDRTVLDMLRLRTMSTLSLSTLVPRDKLSSMSVKFDACRRWRGSCCCHCCGGGRYPAAASTGACAAAAAAAAGPGGAASPGIGGGGRYPIASPGAGALAALAVVGGTEEGATGPPPPPPAIAVAAVDALLPADRERLRDFDFETPPRNDGMPPSRHVPPPPADRTPRSSPSTTRSSFVGAAHNDADNDDEAARVVPSASSRCR
jgi:hypothetical protein